jgi:predicted PurR-regulated permease PerM
VLAGRGAVPQPRQTSGSKSAASSVSELPEPKADVERGTSAGFVHLEAVDTEIMETVHVPASDCGGNCDMVLRRLQQTWDALSIIFCVVVLVAVVGSIVAMFYASLEAFDWNKYGESPRLKDLYAWLEKRGMNETGWESIMRKHQGEAMVLASSVVDVIANVVVTLLLFFFCLVAILPGIKQQVPKSRMRRMMQNYLLCKTLTSLIVASAVMLSLWVMQVDLVLVFGVLTFFLNYIPNIGSFFAVVAPAPLVYLTPGKTLNDVALSVLVPFIIHNTLGCTLEPQLMQAGLDLHPLTMVVALTFWGAVWGIPGMVLAVPITCGLRLSLQETDHPYSRLVINLMDKPFTKPFSPKSR